MKRLFLLLIICIISFASCTRESKVSNASMPTSATMFDENVLDWALPTDCLPKGEYAVNDMLAIDIPALGFKNHIIIAVRYGHFYEDNQYSPIYLLAQKDYGFFHYYLVADAPDCFLLYDFGTGREGAFDTAGDQNFSVGDIDGDNLDELIVQIYKSDQAKESYIFKIMGNKLKVIYSDPKTAYPSGSHYFDSSFECEPLPDKHVRIYNERVGYSEVFDFSLFQDQYSFDDEERLLADFTLSPLSDFFKPIDIDDDGIQEIFCSQNILFMGSGGFGTAVSILKYNAKNDKMEMVEASVIDGLFPDDPKIIDDFFKSRLQ